MYVAVMDDRMLGTGTHSHMHKDVLEAVLQEGNSLTHTGKGAV